MSASTKTELNAAYLLGRLERLPMSLWQVKLRLVVGTATFFDAFDALTIAYVMTQCRHGTGRAGKKTEPCLF
ncbi:MAG: hypothetical protein ACUVSK_03140 [Desulfotomaculales bacterium]